MSANASSSWPTPNATDHKGVSQPEGRRPACDDDLPSRAERWPTPRAGDGDKFSAGKQRHDCLTQVAKTWPTPCARDHMPAHTPEYIAEKKAQGHGMKILTDAVSTWPTPASRDYRTPNSQDSQDSQDRRNTNNRGQQLPNFVEHCLLPPLVPPTPGGQKSSPSTRRLNPLFVEWLMQWPIGWTDCASPVTGFSRWLQRSRTALSELLSTQDERPEPQMTLF